MKKITPKTIAIIAISALVVISFAIAFISMGAKSCARQRENDELFKKFEDMSEEPFAEVTFPTTGLAAKLPVPKSNFGRLERDSSDYFRITVANTSKADFDEYVEKCKENGFTVDYSKTESDFSAYDQEGYYLRISFHKDDSSMTISIDAPSPETEAPTEKPTEKPTQAPATKAPQNKATEPKSGSSSAVSRTTIRDEIKEAIDSYETFVDEYCDFMKNYDSSNPALFTEYMELLEKEVEMTEEFEKIENMELTEAEEDYYLEVALRCTEKLSNAALSII